MTTKNPLAVNTPTTQLSDAVVIVVPSHSAANVTYTVTFPVNGQPTCTCKGYGYRGTCSHIKEAADKLLDKLIERGLLKTSNNPDQPLPVIQHHCATCGVELTGTHAFLDKCAACYRHDTLITNRAS